MIPPIKLSHHIPTIDLVRQFHETFGHPVAKRLDLDDVKLRRLRVQLVLNELAELAQALGVPIDLTVRPVLDTEDAARNVDPKNIMNGMVKNEWVAPVERCYPMEKVDVVETADALGDLDVVVNGGFLAFGMPAGLIAHAIHISNMSKLDEYGNPIYDENGKIMKGPNFREPEIKGVLDTFVPESELL